jgi:hypothetical protein
MRELRNHQNNSRTFRWNLLLTVSAFALLGAAYKANASESDTDHPILWVEVGGQLSRLDNGEERLTPPFLKSYEKSDFVSPLPLERPPLYSIDETGKISFQPNDSDWVLSIAVRYGRTGGNAYRHQQTNEIFPGLRTVQPTVARFRYAEATTGHDVMHAILDFMVGKDVGLGVFGATSTLSAGARFAQFHSKSNVGMYADPDYARSQGSGLPHKYFHNYSLRGENKASFTGIGPALSWDASIPLLGGGRSGQITFDWNLNGAVLFGRQKSQGSSETKGILNTGVNIPFLGFYYHTTHYTHPHSHNRSRMAAVPDVGAAAGLSFRYGAAKISAGYRADLFFGAMDGGIDTRKSENVGFYGPFATVSIGIGG